MNQKRSPHEPTPHEAEDPSTAPAPVLPRGLTAEPEIITIERLLEIIRLAPIGVGIVDMKGYTVMTNDALRRMLGYSAEEFASMPFEDFTHPDDIARNAELFGRMVAGELDRFEMDKRFIHRDGHTIWGRLLVSLLREGSDEPSLAIGLLTDITEERRLRAELERMAFHDALTDLPNRRVFDDRVEHLLRRADREPHRVGAVLFVDLDDLKELNDAFGHAAGDEVLRILARRLTAAIRPGDTAARLGGDEFGVLIETVEDLDHAVAVAQRVRGSLRHPIRISGADHVPSVSIGVALVEAARSLREVMTLADRGMYEAKRSGKDRVAVAPPHALDSVRGSGAPTGS